MYRGKLGIGITSAFLICAETPAAYANQDGKAPPPPDPEKQVNQPEATPQESVDDIFRSVFGKERPTAAQGYYGVLVDGIFVGEFDVKPGNAKNGGEVSSKFIRNILVKALIGDAARKIKELTNGRDTIAFAMLEPYGVKIKFDDNQLVLRVDTPIEIRQVRNLNLRRLRNFADANNTVQSKFSAYVSVRAGVTLVEDSAAIDAGFDRFVADIDIAANIMGVAATAELRYDSIRTRKFTRGDVRLSYDDRDSLVRYELGDLSIGRRPFQNAPRIAGLSAFRKYAINPYLNFRPTPEQAFELDRPARVEVLVNGTALRTFDLRSGRYNLRDLPIVASAGNDIELRIQYASGQTEIRVFPAFYDLELLSPGLSDFAVNIGLPYEDRNGIREYDDNDYNGTAYFRYGINSTLTAGVHWEGNRRFDLLGSELVWASPLGTFGINASTNIRKPALDSSQLTLQYRWRDTDPDRERAIDGLISLTGKDYQTLNQIFAGSFNAKQVRVRAGQKVGKDTRAQIFAGYDEFRGGIRSSYYAGVNISHQFRFGSLSAGVEYRRSDDEKGLAFRLGLSIPLGRSSISSSYFSEDNSARIEYSRLATVGVNSLGFSAGADRRDGNDRQFARASFIGNRFEASVRQVARNYFTSRNSRDMRTEFNVGSALVMADGQFAISRPVRNSFAIVKADKRAGSYQLAVEPRTGFGSTQTKYSGLSGALGPAVITSLTPYFDRSVQVDAPDAPAGTSLDGQVFRINASDKSGFLLTVGNAANVSLVGNLVDKDGDPLVYISGEAISRDAKGEDIAPLPLFTNAKGRFFVEGLEAGQAYDIKVNFEDAVYKQTLEIPDETTGMYRIGDYIFYEIDAPSLEEPTEQKETENAPEKVTAP